MQVAGIDDPNDIPGLSAKKLKSTTFFDAIARPMQVVDWKASPLKNDIVTPLVYDKNGFPPEGVKEMLVFISQP
jgi:hypothetical protein